MTYPVQLLYINLLSSVLAVALFYGSYRVCPHISRRQPGGCMQQGLFRTQTLRKSACLTMSQYVLHLLSMRHTYV